MEKTSTLVNNIHSNTKTYINLRTKAIKLEIYERVTNLIASGISAAFIAMVALLAFMFLNVGVGFWLGYTFGSFAKGFFALGGFYLVVLGIYMAVRKSLVKNSVKNAVLLKVSKTMNDYDLLVSEQVTVQGQLSLAETHLKENFDDLKENLNTLKEDINRVKGHFVSHKDEEKNTTVGPKIPRIAITGALDLILNRLVLKNSGTIIKTLLPVITNALVTSKVFKEDKTTSLFENLKLKFSKFL
jgi:hypothetical protein